MLSTMTAVAQIELLIHRAWFRPLGDQAANGR